MTEYPEPPGCQNSPGFVKSNPLNNETYLEKCCEVYPTWADLLRETHAKLEEIVPGYNIAQIKDKFGGLRYYIGMPESWYEEELEDDDVEGIKHHNDISEKVREITWDAEEKAVNLNDVR